MSSEEAEALSPNLFVERFTDGSEGVTAASVYFLEMWEAVSLIEHRGGNVAEA